MTIVELVLSLGAILLAAFLFTNAVEILGERLDLGQGAVGSVLAAVGTALPETMIPIVAILGALILGNDPQTAGEIGVGAILGAPFLLATLAMCVIGASALLFRERRESGVHLTIDEGVVARDIRFFLVFYAAAAAAGIIALPFYLKAAVGVVLLLAYAHYVRRTLASGGAELEEIPERLILWRFSSQPPTWAAAGQLLGALAVMIAGAEFFVDAVEHASRELGIPAGLISLVLAPLATELPEKFNSVIWLRENKDTLAFGNVSGAMVFQSTVPVTLGILFTPWDLKFLDLFSVGLALASGLVLFLMLRGKRRVRAEVLLGGGLMYAAFVVAAVVVVL
ncbi:hypothetical protein Rxycam_01892 [Rubrobacter xylanophilus DSM 9941]|uniref:sodium:calcium antiporter n=1 Tax=Rubrobacter xylanophilus TaxID=49319 RepID=UPI001C63EFA4|nr:hypothetical protein [Rubrobacter xylanophilus]QYJ16061.1 hypothetical protein Rxycam_01892 [Rubrobacter xylanophilus DSM 9941]